MYRKIINLISTANANAVLGVSINSMTKASITCFCCSDVTTGVSPRHDNGAFGIVGSLVHCCFDIFAM